MSEQRMSGKVSSIKRFNNWAKAIFISHDGMTHSITGEKVCEMENGHVYEITFNEKKHAKWGLSLEIVHFMPYIDASPTALVKFLKKNYKGIGEVTAKKMVEDFRKQGRLEELRQNLLSNPYAIDFTPYTNRPVLAQIREGLNNFIQNAMLLRFGSVKSLDARNFKMLSAYLSEKLALKYNGDLKRCAAPIDEAVAIYTENPYAPIKDVEFYGFRTADDVGMFLGFERDNEARLAALAAHVLSEACVGGGHVFLPAGEFAVRLRQFDPTVSPKQAVDAALASGEYIVEENGNYYPEVNYRNETGLAFWLAGRLSRSVKPMADCTDAELEHKLENAQQEMGILLHETQAEAVRRILTSKCSIHTLTAGPGCGKTALMQIVMSVLGEKKRIMCAAPTGKAAKVLKERVAPFGRTATTIHSMLGVQGQGQFNHSSTNPLPCDVLVVDESGMNDLALTKALLSAVPAHAHVVFLGDTKQLPSIGPGDVLADLMKIEAIDHQRLSKTFRNQGGILDLVKQVGEGKSFIKNDTDVTFHDLPEADFDSINRVIKIYTRAVRDNDNDLSKVGLLVARRKGDKNNPGWNVTYLNEVLRNQFNVHGAKIPGTVFHVEDRIIVRKNASFLQFDPSKAQLSDDAEEKKIVTVVNGDTGFIIDFIMDEEDRNRLKYLVLKLDDDSVVYYPADLVNELGLAYAITVHAAQGSEYNHVIFLNVNGAPSFIHRGIVFTGVSRAKKKLDIFTQADTWHQVCARPIPPRNSLLVSRFEDDYQKIKP